ncbi:MAG: hypothetical protein VB078_10130 [Clostridiaceae bacterium]|nr:hypothetical protein [Clostridiaceae bacterium]
MSVKTKEKIYNGIILLCVSICILLIGTVAIEELFGGGPVQLHTPPEVGNVSDQANTSTTGEIFIDENTIENELAKYIDDDFPLKNITVDIMKSGEVTIGAEASKAKLTDYLENAGVKINGQGGLFALLLPKKIDVSFTALFAKDEESGMLTLSPQSISAGKLEIDMTSMPENFFCEISEGINKLIIASEYYFTDIEFRDGGILLIP